MSQLLDMAAADVTAPDLRPERDRFVAFAFAAAHVFFEVDANLKITYTAGALQWLFGARSGVVTGQNLADLLVRDDRRLLKAACSLAQRDGKFRPLTVRFRRADGGTLKTVATGTALPNGSGLVHIAVQSCPVTRTLPSAPTEHRSQPDPATDSAALVRVITEAASAARQSGEALSMTLIELEGLARLRDGLPPVEAAELMADIEAHLRSCAIDGAPVTQLSLESYGLLHHDDLNVTGLEQRLGTCTQAHDVDGDTVHIRAATLDVTDTGLSESELAKAVVYTINRFTEERGDFTISDLGAAYKEILNDTGTRLADLKKVIASNAFDLVFQPIVELASRQVHHHEALVRFRQQDPGESPFGTITFAEQVDLIAPLDLAICRKAVAMIQSAQRASQDLRLAVNLSGRSLEIPAFLERLTALLGDAGLDGSQLMFEVTESSMIKDLEATNNFLVSLQTLGHQICLDDFGAGASAFQYLRALSVDYVKIDGSYILATKSDQNALAFIRSMTDLCSELKIETIGEMIEDDTVAATLETYGVRYGQGYLFGRPVNQPLTT